MFSIAEELILIVLLIRSTQSIRACKDLITLAASTNFKSQSLLFPKNAGSMASIECVSFCCALWTRSSSSCSYQYGVPTKELAGEAMEAEPKSASFTWPGSVSRMFPALISLRKTEESVRANHSFNKVTQPRATKGETAVKSGTRPSLSKEYN